VLVHGDPSVAPFERTFLSTERIASRLTYTGYIVDDRLARDGDPAAGTDEVIVSAGGGAVGARLLETAIRARPLTSLADRTWRVLAGINLPATDFEALQALIARDGDGRVVLERARHDFTVLLKNGFLSISQVGYNTTMEILQAGIRAVGVPFAAGAEIEQTLRAQLLAARGLLELVEEKDLDSAALAVAIERAAARAPTTRPAIDLDGATRSAALIEGWAGQ
ncbi:MAG: glycosyltransferase, partial [Proteobacteria bacterium]|nr:glycosyltransferase [Pseudomonadota bacterium]